MKTWNVWKNDTVVETIITVGEVRAQEVAELVLELDGFIMEK